MDLLEMFRMPVCVPFAKVTLVTLLGVAAGAFAGGLFVLALFSRAILEWANRNR